MLLLTILIILLNGCTLNNPYRASERYRNIYYTTFDEPPKHLDPARSYSSNEYSLIGQIYEPLLQYHYLKRPYELIPLSAESVPEPVYLDRNGRRLNGDAPAGEIHRVVYEIRIKKGIMYQNHPAFARGPDGRLLYAGLEEEDLDGIEEIKDFEATGTRELVSDDFIYQIMRLADPQLHCPILPILEKYILGLDEYADSLRREVEEIRKKRRNGGDAGSGRAGDPIILDYSKYPLPGVQRVDRYTFRIILKRKYPQFVYWLAMPFFSPMPREADLFYKQPPLIERNITLDRFPVGTGPFRIEVYSPQREIVLVKNENFHGEPYPSEGEPGDREAGLLDDAGSPMPFIERIVFKLEKEAIPRWNKFLQGYYDVSGITSDSFDQAVTITPEGGAELTGFMKDKGISLLTSVRPSIYYMGFNMLDDTVGGYTEAKKKLRQAISIAIDYEEYIEIFTNGRGIPAMGPVPPGIFGHLEGEEGINPFIYRWNAEKARPERRSIDEARRLLSEAGYPGGRDREGRPLVITFDNAWTGVDAKQMISWYIKRLKLLGIQLENRTTDYNRFQDKMLKGNFQLFSWGWNADYPDPENFFFLLVGANSKVRYGGENAANYSNPEFDRLFRIMENMDNTPERLDIIKRMTRIVQEDAPWVWGYYPVSFTLVHRWVHNLKPNAMANNTMKYIRIDARERAELRREWNRPVLWPIAALAVAVIIALLPAFMTIRKRLGL